MVSFFYCNRLSFALNGWERKPLSNGHETNPRATTDQVADGFNLTHVAARTLYHTLLLRYAKKLSPTRNA